MSIILTVLSATAAAIYIAAMQQDLFRRQIPNSLSIALIAVALVKWISVGDMAGAGWALAVAAIVFGVTFLLFARGWMGGGDVKLLTASSFFLGAWATYPFLVCTALAGGLITLLVIARNWSVRRFRHADDGTIGAGSTMSATVPYGVAISIGALWIMAQQALLNQQTFLR